jgi:serine/threonine-protein kinase RsbW
VGQLRTSPPPPDAQELHVWILNTSTELRDLRASLNSALVHHGSSPAADMSDIADRMVLVATELATNAIRHGRPPTEVRLLCTPDQFVLDVADHDLSSVPELADTRPIGAGGRGLKLAQSFSLEVGWYATDSTKHIWATFPVNE